MIDIDALLAMDDAAMLREAYRMAHGTAAPPGAVEAHLQAMAEQQSERLPLVLDIVQEARRAGHEVTVRFGSPVQRYLGELAGRGQGHAPAERAADISGLCRAEGEDFVHQCYIHLLGKEADEGGLNHYANELRNGVSRLEIIARLLRAARQEGGARTLRVDAEGLEFLIGDLLGQAQHRLSELLAGDDATFIANLYLRLLGKQVDPDGLAGYLWMLQSGWSRLQVLARILQDGRTAGRMVSVAFDLDPAAVAQAAAHAMPPQEAAPLPAPEPVQAGRSGGRTAPARRDAAVVPGKRRRGA